MCLRGSITSKHSYSQPTQGRVDFKIRSTLSGYEDPAPKLDSWHFTSQIGTVEGYKIVQILFSLIAAHLNPSNQEEWVKLAEMSLEQDNIKQAIFCYSKGPLRSQPRATASEDNTAPGSLQASPLVPGQSIGVAGARSYYETNNLLSAIGVLEEALAKHPGLVTVEGVSMVAELYISIKEYPKPLEVTIQSQDVRHHCFCLRLMLKHPENLVLCVLNGHSAFDSGSFKHALDKV
ncbi:TF3C3 factor, partial [Polyodon spathula]|nr:TF3C3 factor [Polyodon spathula]